jgi:hypothetical protein
MTDQRQSTRDQRVPQAPTLEQADPDWSGPSSSTQDSTAGDLTETERPDEDGTIYQSATHESAVDESIVDGPPVDGTAADEPVANERTAEQPAGDGEGVEAVEESVPAGQADVDHGDLERAIGVAAVPDAEQGLDMEADTVDRDNFDSPGVTAQTDGADVAHGTERRPANAQAAVEE